MEFELEVVGVDWVLVGLRFFVILADAKVGRWEDSVACQHYSSLDVHSHR